uniref:P-type domain-containing protein n=1 Tax=Globodera pallida TaxID=36090 RepID=A0A183C9F7_GLOPA
MLILFLLLCGPIIFCSAIVDPSQRVDCLPNPHEISKSACLETGCIWDGNYDQYNPSVPMCYYPPTEGYTIQSSVPGNVQLKWTSKTLQNPYSRPNLDVQNCWWSIGIVLFPGPNTGGSDPAISANHRHTLFACILGLRLPAVPMGATVVRRTQKNTVQRVRDAKIPFDVQYADIDYMERYKDFTYDTEKWAGLPEFADQLHSWDMKLVLIWDPPVQANYSSFQRAIEKGVSFIEWPNESMVQKEINDLYPLTRNTNIMLGPMWPDHHCGFPDFLDPLPNTTDWWVDEFVRFHDKVNFDGIWIDMNEPSVFGTNEQQPWYFDPAAFGKKPPIAPLICPKPNNNLDYPPYRTWNSYQWDWDKSLGTATLNGIPVTLDPALSEFVPEKGALTVQCADLIKLDDLAHDVWTLSWHNEGKHGPDAEEENSVARRETFNVFAIYLLATFVSTLALFVRN